MTTPADDRPAAEPEGAEMPTSPPEAIARDICALMEARMREMGVITTSHYDAGMGLIIGAITAERSARDAAVGRAEAMERERRWIAVKDRLPTEGQTVDAWVVNRGRHTDAYVYFVNANGIALWQDRYGNNVGGANVTHWMPLPSPPSAAAPAPETKETER